MSEPVARPAEMIPATRQRRWGLPAVANFGLGGVGAGFYVAAALAARLDASPVLTLASWLGPVLVLAGFAGVAAEAGRPLRGARVLTRLASSWMSRELALGLLFAAAAGAELVAAGPALRVVAVVAALALAAAQGLIVRRATAVTAWDVGLLPVLFVLSALVSGAGALLVVTVLAGDPVTGAELGAAMALLVVGLLGWLAYVTWSEEPDFARATETLRGGPAAVALIGGGYLAPFALAALAMALGGAPEGGPAAAGVLIVAGQIYAKWLLIVAAGALRPVTVENLRLQRRIS